MKKSFRYITKSLALFLMFGLLCSVSGYGQRFSTTLKFKDGRELKGLGKLISKDRVKFRQRTNDKPEKYDFDLFEYVIIRYSNEDIKYVQFPVEGWDKPAIVREFIIGKMCLYKTSASGYTPSAGNFGTAGSMGAGAGMSYTVNNYFLKRKDSDTLIHMGSNHLFSKKFNELAATFFEDCPELAKKIKNKVKGFRKKNLEEIVKYFNTNCH